MSLYVKTTNANDFKEYRADYVVFLKKIAHLKSPAFVNMGPQIPMGFLHLVDNLKRWQEDDGEIALLYDDISGSIVGISAVENSQLSTELSSGGNRCWILPKYRQNNEITKYLLKSNLDWTRNQGKAGMLLTFNEYNKWIHDTIVKLSTNSGATLGTVWSEWWDDCIALPRMVRIHNTPQWAVIKPLDEDRCTSLVEELDKKYGVRDKPFISTAVKNVQYR
jgi:hypothetical protein